MTLENRIENWVTLGQWLKKKLAETEFEDFLWRVNNTNNWFTTKFSRLSLEAIANEFLDEASLRHWATQYDFKEHSTPKNIGVVMAGNIPAVGFHDALAVLLSGHNLMAKLSKDDATLLPFLLNQLIEINPKWQERISFVERLNTADAYIATGSDNTARYFEYYFSKKPHVIRKNRSSIAILDGQESPEELALLGHDMLRYFGLGCRNVSKVFVPEGYVFDRFYESIEHLGNDFVHHHKYFNNYEYNKSIYLVNRELHFDNGFLILRESPQIVSPISVIFYEYYTNQNALHALIAQHQDKIQCKIGHEYLPFGQAQCPTLFDYADGIDTMLFLAGL